MSDEHSILSSGELVPRNISRSLFPHSYYVDPSEPRYEQYCHIIREHGGHLSGGQDDSTAYHLSSGPWEGRQTYSLEFVDHCLKSESALPIERFAFPSPVLPKKRPGSYDEEDLHAIDTSSSPVMENRVKRPRDKLSKSTTKFTPEADTYILEQVRMRPRFRTSHKFFEDLAKHDILSGHTGNSVRSRFRAHLEHKLQYVFKTDDFDNLVLDENGHKIPVEVSSAKTMKNKFTAEDDFHLCDDVIRHVASVQNNHASELPDGRLDENKFSVSISFFDEYARRYPQHSSSSWRDRYRKFARPHGLQKYRDEYIRDFNSKEGPKPMKNMTSRKDRDKGQNRDTVKRAKDSKVKSGTRKIMKATEDRDTAAAAVAALSTIDMLGGHHSSHLLDHHIDPDMGMTSRESAALDEEIGGVKNSNIDHVLRSVDAGQDMSAIHPTLAGTGVDPNVEPINLALRDSMSQDSSRIYRYMDAESTFEDIFSDKFYRQNPERLMKELGECLIDQGNMELEELSRSIQKLGFTEAFVSHVFCVTSGSAEPILRFIERVLESVQDAKGLKVSDVLFIEDEQGFWTPDADEALLKGDLDRLRHMKEEDFNQRRYFFGLEE